MGLERSNYESFRWKQRALFEGRISKDFVKCNKDSTPLLWHYAFGQFGSNIKIGCPAKNNWHESKVNHLVWDDLVVNAKMVWARLVELVRMSVYLAGNRKRKEKNRIYIYIYIWSPIVGISSTMDTFGHS